MSSRERPTYSRLIATIMVSKVAFLQLYSRISFPGSLSILPLFLDGYFAGQVFDIRWHRFCFEVVAEEPNVSNENRIFLLEPPNRTGL